MNLTTNTKRIHQIEPWIGTEEKEAIARYLDSNAWLTEFEQTREFERRIAEYAGCKHAAVVTNGTVSLFIALQALGVGPGDEVIVPNFTMVASANAVLMAGATPVLVDIERPTLCLDPELARRGVTSRTKAIMHVSLNGRSRDMERLAQFAREHKLHLVEDAAQALGSRWRGKHLGTFGDIGSFSFSHPKVITTGQGGALVTDNSDLYARILGIKDFGRSKSGVDFHQTLGYNFKFTDIQAVLGIEQMKKLPWRVERKKGMFKLYRTELAEVEAIQFIETNLEDVSPWFMDIRVPDPTALRNFLQQHGIGCRPFYPPIHSQPAYGWKGSYPVSEDVSAHGLWLPSSSFLTDEDVRWVCAKIREFFQTTVR